MTQEGQPITDNLTTRRPFFYRDKRVLLSFMVSLPIAYFGDLFAAVFMHLAMGVLMDWWFFEFKKVKESDVTPAGWLNKVGMTREQLDEHSTIFMWLRHGAFLFCSLTALGAYYFNFSTGYEGAFCSAYFTFRLLSTFYPASKNMIYPWVGARSQMQGNNRRFYMANMMNPYATFSPAYGNSSSNSAENNNNTTNMMDPSNIIGFLNPISPNYIGNSSFNSSSDMMNISNSSSSFNNND